jgi:hypothetical protein
MPFAATEIIEYDEKFSKLISFILDGVYIVEENTGFSGRQKQRFSSPKAGNSPKENSVFPEDLWDCLKEKELDGPRTWRNWKKKSRN